jgi:hypothetical protein
MKGKSPYILVLGLALLSIVLAGCARPVIAIVWETRAPDSAPIPTRVVDDTTVATPSSTATLVPTDTAQPTPTHTATATSSPTVTPSPTATRRPTATPWPTVTRQPTATPWPTPLPDAVVIKAINLRTGPGLVYDVIRVLPVGTEVKVIGQVENCGWLQVITADGTEAWMGGSSEYVERNLRCGAIPLAPVPLAPTAIPLPVGPTVTIPVRNNTGSTLKLELDGPARYSFTILPGDHDITVVVGTYSYTGYGCGGASKSGSYVLDLATDWTWWCS